MVGIRLEFISYKMSTLSMFSRKNSKLIMVLPSRQIGVLPSELSVQGLILILILFDFDFVSGQAMWHVVSHNRFGRFLKKSKSLHGKHYICHA